MSYKYERYESQRRQGYGASGRRTTLGYWVPLAMTVTVATIGLAAWIWSERKDKNHVVEDYDKRGDGRPPPTFPGAGPGGPPGQPAYARDPTTQQTTQVEDESIVSRVQGALRRTPSPQQIFDGASRRVVAGVAAAGAVVGGALSSIREEDRRDFEDHSRWSEEAQARVGSVATQGPPAMRGGPTSGASGPQISPPRPNDKRKTVTIVVSAENKDHGHSREEEIAYMQEHASILSHLPHHIDEDSRVFVLIYVPDLTQHPLSSQFLPGQATASLASSYSNIGHEDAHTPGEEFDKPLTTLDPRPIPSPARSEFFNAVYKQARELVENETMVMPFTTPTGYVHLLRHIGPEVVYVQELLSGPGGDAVLHIAGWVGQVVLVVGDESGHGGLVDSEDERAGYDGERKESWWQNSPQIGLGKGIEVVDGLRVGEDWRRRVGGHD